MNLPSITTALPESKPYQPFGSALDVFYAHDDEVIVDGPAGTGKSRACLEKLHLICMKYPNSRCLMVRKTRESLTQSAMVTFDLHVLPNNGTVSWRTQEQEYRYWNGSKIVVGGMDKSSRIMSTEYDLIYVQEVTELTEGEYEDLTTRARNGIVPYNQVLSDCNPQGANHWVKRRWEEGKAKRIQSHHEDNPTLWDMSLNQWTPKGKSYIRKLDNLSGVRKRRLRGGEWVTAEGTIYDQFLPEIHIVDPFPIPLDWRRIGAIDFGYTNPFVCQWWAIDPDNNMYLYREIYQTKRTVKIHSKDIKDYTAENEYVEIFVCDWDAEDRATLEENGIFTTPADKQVGVGIEKVIERMKIDPILGKPKIFFFSNSLVEEDWHLRDSYKPIKTTEEVETYIWANKDNKDVPVKVDDHGMDAMRYAVMYVDNYVTNGGVWT